VVALWNRVGHYIFAMWFLLLSSSILFFFPRLISAVADWVSAILPHMVCLRANLRCRSETCCTGLAGNAGPKKVTKNRHLGTIAQLCRAISSQLRQESTIGKMFVKQQYLLQCPHNRVNFGSLAAKIGLSV